MRTETPAVFPSVFANSRLEPGHDTTLLPRHWHFATAGSENRPAVEAFIAAGFRKAYDARLNEFMPELVALYDSGVLAAACGLRRAKGARLFLEQYLDTPVEQMLDELVPGTDRRTIVEVGNLSIARPGYARHLVTGLTGLLHARGMQWALFSAVPALRNNFIRLGIPLFDLGPADPARLPAAARANWGSYYRQSPRVMAVQVDDAFAALGPRP
jgi:hypothetical protein